MTKGLEALKEIGKKGLWNIVSFPEKEFQIVEKELKALEIIKKKMVDVGASQELDLELYNKYVKEINGTPTLTQQEYDLLKEVI